LSFSGSVLPSNALSAGATILVVDDEEDTAALLRDALTRRGYRALAVSSGIECLEYLRSGVADVVVTDVQMPGMSGIELCHELHLRHPDLLVIVLTGVVDLENAIAAIRASAYDFITKPVKFDVLDIAIKRALEHLAVRREVNRLRLGPAITVHGILGASPQIRATIELTRRAATSDATVLVTGESGTGKELVARVLHQGSSRASEPFVALNCGAVPAPLLESELFGHVRGAFTDAKRSRPGLFVQAGAGTLFLDEIGEMPLDMQVKLLRALQERKVRAVGADEEQPFACRIVAATNRDLELEVEGRRFREDLFYRINVVVIPVPTLRERGGADIIELARWFLAKVAPRSRRPPLELSPAAVHRLTEYDWPGNVRELENCIERAVAIARGPSIEVADLPEKIAKFKPTQIVFANETPEEMMTLDELNRRYVHRVLAMVKGNKTYAAKVLGIDRRSLYRRLAEFDGGLSKPLETTKVSAAGINHGRGPAVPPSVDR
jgi:DNA-binding NtrC family response regulator